MAVTFNRDESPARAFEVRVDGTSVGEQRIARRSPQELERFFDVTYPLAPELVAGQPTVTVRFQAAAGSETGTVYGIRVVRGQKQALTAGCGRRPSRRTPETRARARTRPSPG